MPVKHGMSQTMKFGEQFTEYLAMQFQINV